MSAFFQNLENLLKKNGITKRKFQQDLSLSVGTVQKWKERGNIPRQHYLVMIADYFGVTVDYLTTPHDPEDYDKEKAMIDRIIQQVSEKMKSPTADIDSERSKIIELLSDMDKKQLEQVKDYLEFLLSKSQ